MLNIYDGGVHQPPQPADSFMEESISGNVFVVDGKLGQGNSPYMHCLVAATLTGKSMQLTSRCCAHTGSAADFASEQFVRRLGAVIRKIPGRQYNFLDAGGNPVRVIGEATLYLQSLQWSG